jgi:uncharacterized protein YuzE
MESEPSALTDTAKMVSVPDNVKILERPGTLEWNYDAEADVLYVSLGSPRAAEGVDVGEGVVVRYDPEQREVVGLTVIGMRAKLLRGLGSASEAEPVAVHDRPRKPKTRKP